MILKDKENDIIDLLGGATYNLEVDTTDKKMLLRFCTEGLYKDPIGSSIREYLSNAIDANKESGSTKPVLTGIGNDGNYNKFFYVKDSGIGISPDRVNNILRKFGASTKRETNDFIGAFGLGFKVGLSYNSIFFMDTVFEGVLYKYMIHRDNGGGKISEISREDTTQESGTLIKLFIERESDVKTFKEKLLNQCAYLENVFYEDGQNDIHKIYDYGTWLYSTLNTDPNMHIVLGNVYYPIDYSKLGIKPIEFPCAIKIGFDEGVVPIQSREDIIYDEHSIELLLKKFKAVVTNIVEIKNADISNFEGNFKEYLFKEFEKFFKFPDERRVNIYPTCKAFYMQDDLLTFMPEKLRKYYGGANTDLNIFSERGYRTFLSNYMLDYPVIRNFTWRNLFDANVPIVYSKKKLNKNTIKYKYAQSFYKNRFISIYKRCDIDPTEIYGSDSYFHLLRLNLIPEEHHAEIIKIYEETEEWFLKTFCIDWESIEVPKSFKNINTKIAQKYKSNVVKIGRLSEKNFQESNLVFEFRPINPKQLFVYCTEETPENKAKLSALWNSITKFGNTKKHILVGFVKKKCIFDLRNNCISMEDFVKSKHIRGLVTAIVVKERIFQDKVDSLLVRENFWEESLAYFNTEAGESLKKLYYYHSFNIPKDALLKKELLELAAQYHLYNEDYFSINKWFEDVSKWNFLLNVNLHVSSYSKILSPNAAEFVVEYCKLKGIRLNKQFYNLKNDVK